MNNNAEFAVEKDGFTVEADVEEGIDERWCSLAENLLGEKKSQKESLVQKFKQAIEQDSYLKTLKSTSISMDNGYLTRFLRAGSWDVDAALEVLRSYSNLGKEYTEYVSRAIPSKLDRVWSNHLNTMTEKRDKFGRRVYIFRLGQWDPDTVPVEEFYASAYVLLELVAREVKTQIAGVTVVSDVSGFGFKHLRVIGLEQIRCIAAFMTGSFPLWFNRIHVINHPRLFNILFNMIKPFLNDRMKDNIVFHGNDLLSLHQEVCPELLPADLGGSGDLDNSAVVAAAKKIDNYYQEHVKSALATCNSSKMKEHAGLD